MPPGRAAQLGDWWPFVLMVIVTWGLLPRLLMLVFAQWRLRGASRVLLRGHSEVTALCDRLVTPSLTLGGDVEMTTAQDPTADVATVSIDLYGAVVVIWNEACRSDAVDTRHGVIAMASGDSDAKRRQAIDEISPGAAKLIVFTKGWEPPVLEFNDLLEFFRERLGAQVSIVVAPLGLAGQTPTETDLAIWSHAITRFGDPHIYVAGDAQVLT
jgi:hypothetical protein